MAQLENSIEKILKITLKVADGFEELGKLAVEIKQLVGEITGVSQAGTATIWDRGGKAYCRVVDRGRKLIILPMESLQIKPDSPPMKNFLEPRVLERMKEKHGISYRLEIKQGILHAIVLEGGNLTQKLKQELKNPITWALEKSVS
jgi:hypothetical protein